MQCQIANAQWHIYGQIGYNCLAEFAKNLTNTYENICHYGKLTNVDYQWWILAIWLNGLSWENLGKPGRKIYQKWIEYDMIWLIFSNIFYLPDMPSPSIIHGHINQCGVEMLADVAVAAWHSFCSVWEHGYCKGLNSGKGSVCGGFHMFPL